MHLGFFPIRLTVEKLEIAEDERFKSQFPFTQTQKLDVRVGVSGLFGGNVEIDSIELVQPQVELIRNKAGIWNFSSLAGTPASPAPGAPDSGKAAPTKDKSTFSLNRLTI